MVMSSSPRFSDVAQTALVAVSANAAAPGSRSGRRKQHLELARRLRAVSGAASARDAANELAAITCVEELEIDYEEVLGVKRGDLAIIQGETFRCYPRAPHLSEIPLILKRLDCVDRRTFDQKWYEIDTFSRFRGHPNIVSLYSYWKEEPANAYTYKTIVMVLEEGVLGDMATSVVQAPKRPSERLVLKWCCDIAKALVAIHNCQIIHNKVRPSSIYLDVERNAMLGEFGKLDVDVARRTHKLFSKILIGAAIPHTLVYWAPELLRLESYGLPADIWSFGVTLFQLATGELPFDISNEEAFRDDVLTANVDWSKLDQYPTVARIVENCLRVEPEERWNAHQILAIAEEPFAVELQRSWRGYRERKNFSQVRDHIIRIQAVIRGYLQFTRFRRYRTWLREQSAKRIQAAYRGYYTRSTTNHIRECLLKCQANVIARQCRRSYLRFRLSVTIGQSAIRRFLVMRWYRKVKSSRLNLENKLRTLQSMVIKYREEASSLQNLFVDRKLPSSLHYLNSLEHYELSIPQDLLGEMGCALPILRSTVQHDSELESDLASYERRVEEAERESVLRKEEEESLQQELGIKYPEYHPMIEALRRNLKRVAQQCQRADALKCEIQHPYSYSKWDQVHEPENIVDNVLADDDSVYRTVTPEIDLTLCDGAVCFLSEIEIHSGEPAPMAVEIYTSNSVGDWTLISSFQCTRDPVQRFLLPGEQLCKYLRLHFPNNLRGGSIVSIRYIRALGLVKADSIASYK